MPKGLECIEVVAKAIFIGVFSCKLLSTKFKW